MIQWSTAVFVYEMWLTCIMWVELFLLQHTEGHGGREGTELERQQGHEPPTEIWQHRVHFPNEHILWYYFNTFSKVHNLQVENNNT